ncbi:right-handed parallel beta-helix repeat-containing protein [Pelagicoccus enzymogenes]|uniref:PDZ domain-containing protein n=1 Tax=Pelagicoccus enzymogenes TaxID=2773457 RepID=UPI00280FE200|nr:PDZ domain-containing protein [Pelagicoccus enzymogenes]MDQ8197868.1 right-handed parallel beta-helix repeat-containing protein [Pelagicoccus enzymogenes]
MPLSLKASILLACSVVINLNLSTARDLYVATDGSDSNPGTLAKPFATLEAARDTIRNLNPSEAVTVHLRGGTYYLPDTFRLTPEDSGDFARPIVYQAKEGEAVVLSGGSALDLKWTAYRDGIMKATTPEGLEIDQLFINGQNQRMARYPNYDASKPTAAYQGYAADAFSKERAARWEDPTGGYIHAMHRARWGGYHYRITGKDANGEVTYEGGWQNNRQMGMHDEFRMVENIFEELDAPGEWYHNAKTNTLYYLPEKGTDLNKATVEVVRLRHLVEFQGSVSNPVRHVTFRGFTVRHAARTFMDTKEPMLRSDWAIYRGGAFMLTGTEDVSILDCEFDQVGGNAVFVNNYNRRTVIKGCHIHDTGASGICFVGDPDAVRDPLFEYREKNDLDKIDRTVGPKTENYPSHGLVEDCLIHGIGRTERQPAGVQIEMAMKITIRDTSIYDTARAGINIGDGAWGGHLIERCDVFDTVLETHDHGSFNSWGRDRFWHADRSESQRVIDKEPNLPFLDAMYTTVIRDSRWRCDHGWDIDLDDGSSNYDIYNNLMLNGGLKFREGFRRRAWNNVMVNNGFHPHVWYENSEDEFYSNIVMRAPRGANTPRENATGKRVDSNLFFSDYPEEQNRYLVSQWDVNSVTSDPQFVDPATGDYRVKEGSPAFDIGFKNFDMDQFGVKKPELRAIARTPILPEPTIARTRPRMPPENSVGGVYWLGARLHGIEGDEFSAYGVRQEDGGVALFEIVKQSEAAQAGLKNGDLIQKLNGKTVKTAQELKQAHRQAGEAKITLQVVRNQQPINIEL